MKLILFAAWLKISYSCRDSNGQWQWWLTTALFTLLHLSSPFHTGSPGSSSQTPSHHHRCFSVVVAFSSDEPSCLRLCFPRHSSLTLPLQPSLIPPPLGWGGRPWWDSTWQHQIWSHPASLESWHGGRLPRRRQFSTRFVRLPFCCAAIRTSAGVAVVRCRAVTPPVIGWSCL